MLLKTICNPDVVCCAPKTTAAQAAALMRERHVGDLVVVDDPDGSCVPLGVITDRDLVVEVMGKGGDAGRTTLESLMRTPVVIARESEDAAAVLERMRVHGVRRVPVVGERQRLVGIVTLDDLVKLLAQSVQALTEIIDRQQAREHRSRR